MATLAERKPRILLGINYEERKNDPPPGLVWRQVKKDETLVSIAAEYNVRSIDLMLYNWHTAVQHEVNWYLRKYVGCKNNNGKTYIFSGQEKPGHILVPNYPPELKKAPPKTVKAARDATSTLDTTIKIRVIEWVANGSTKEITGKWLYVFSGTGGVDFGSVQPPRLPGFDAPADAQPGTAFDPRYYPGTFYIKEQPNKLEYEIFVSTHNLPTTDLMSAVTGSGQIAKPQYLPGNKWHFLSDPKILDEAKTDAREKRIAMHGFRNVKEVTVDLASNKRYYFLLSPVQLGPEAIKFAMANPSGLTPLRKPGDWGKSPSKDNDPTGGIDPDSIHNYGPTVDDVKSGSITIAVIDPYAWAENIAEELFPDGLKRYKDWVGSQKSFVLDKLKKETGWTPDHYYLAKMIQALSKSHKDPDDILDELKDRSKWSTDMSKWEKELIDRNAIINAQMHSSLERLIRWLEGPGHKIIDTAILKDTAANNEIDAVDQGLGILHWSLCTENMIALAPGIDYLRIFLRRQDTVPDKLIFQPIKAKKVPTRGEIALRYAYKGVFTLIALKDFVSPSPVPFGSLTRKEYMEKMADHYRQQTGDLIKLFNDYKILPYELAPLPPPDPKNPVWNTPTVLTAVNGVLDISDKLKTYIVEKDIKINRQGFLTNRLANMEDWFNKRSDYFRNGTSYGISWSLKIFAGFVGGYNLYRAATTAGWDYQKQESTVSTMDWANAAAGATIALQDFIASFAALVDKNSRHVARIFPELTKPGGSFAVPNRIVGVAGRVFAGINVLAMLVSGVTTLVANGKNMRQSMSVGDHTSAAFYFAASIGGAMMVSGAVVLGISLMYAGGAASATGVGATVGVFLFFVGSILAAVGDIIARYFSSTDYQIFARKCFLGKEGDQEPRFAIRYKRDVTEYDPPDWTHALKSGKNTWPIDKQIRAIHNLLGKFVLRTRADEPDNFEKGLEGEIAFDIKPGLLLENSTIEVALYYKNGAAKTTGTVRWLGEDFPRYSASVSGELFKSLQAFFDIKSYAGRTKNSITIFADKLKYDPKKGELLTTVTLRYPGLPNVISCRKLVIKPPGRDLPDFPNNEVTSGLFE